MAPMKESTTVGLGDWLSLETSVLRTLCLTINAEGSELKYRILDSLSEEDFYFPINKAVFSALKDIHRQGDYLVSTTLEEALRARSVDIPGDCFLEDLFRGGLPELPELSEWLSRMKGRGRGVPRAEKAKSPPPASAPSPLRSTPPRVQPVTPAPVTEIRSASDARKRAAKALDSDPAVCKATPPPRSPTLTLASEAEDWASYLNDLAAKQGKSFETGFAGLDEMAGGLSTGLVLAMDTDRDRLSSFLKQLTDQVAERSGHPCLYLCFERSKADLRIRTLARLSGVAAQDIERGRLKKDSREWQEVEKSGREAAAWLKRVFVVETGPQTGVGLTREMCRRLMGSSGDSTCMIVVDSLESLGGGEEVQRAAVAELKKLSDELDVLVVAATGSTALLSDPAFGLTALLRPGEGSAVELEMLRAGEGQSTIFHFDYQPEIHRFVE